MTFEPINYQNCKNLFKSETGFDADNNQKEYILWLNYKTNENVVRQLVSLNQKLDTYTSDRAPTNIISNK